jgi:hypothetical protein
LADSSRRSQVWQRTTKENTRSDWRQVVIWLFGDL